MDLYAPTNTQTVYTVNGNTYISDVQGVFHNVLAADVAAMQTAGALTRDPRFINLGVPVSVNKFSQPTPPAANVDMYGLGSTTITAASTNVYTSTPNGTFKSVLATDVASLTAQGANVEGFQFQGQLPVSQYGRG